VRKAIADMKVPEMLLPKDLPAAASAAQKRIDKNFGREHEDSLLYYLGAGFGCPMAQHSGT